ncbi:MAG: MFS transporter [Armatimonadetes bacterium]|nr:MFS transporter [Armatimonadota bacterium]
MSEQSGITSRGVSGLGALAALVLGHAISDACINFIPGMWPIFQERLGLSAAQIGALSGWVSLTTNFGQPLFGYLADRWRVRRMEAVGPILVGLFIGFMGRTDVVLLFGVFYVIAGLGTAMFHPEAATLVGKVAGERRGLAMAVFSGGGALGYSFGPPIAVFLFERFDMHGLAGATVMGLITGLMLMRVNVGRRFENEHHEPLRLRRDVFPHLHRVGALFLVVVLRSIVIVAFNTFLAILVRDWGEELDVGARVLFLMIFFGGIGNVVGGFISDHLGRRNVTIISLLLSAPFFWAFVHYGLPWGYLLLPIGGFLSQMSVSVNIVQGQELLPSGPGVASSLTMGAAWGVAGLTMPVVGWLVDTRGTELTLMWIGALLIAAAVLAIFVPDRPREIS